jgi:site-specific DNA-methyltransferase (adenine-specific)
MRPYYDHGGVTLFHADCRDILPTLSDVDLVFTSPPYNLGNAAAGGESLGHYDPRGGMSARSSGDNRKWAGGELPDGYGDCGDNLPHEEYVAWQQEVLRLCWGGLSETGAIFYNHKPRVLGVAVVTPLAYIPPDLPLRQVLIWARAGGTNFSPTFYCPTHEWIAILAKPGWRLKSRGASGVGDVWRVPQEAGTEHPAPFPIGLPARAIETTAPRLVVDPFAGGGTTLRAAKDAGVQAIGVELSERWCEVAAKRLSQETLFGATR